MWNSHKGRITGCIFSLSVPVIRQMLVEGSGILWDEYIPIFPEGWLETPPRQRSDYRLFLARFRYLLKLVWATRKSMVFPSTIFVSRNSLLYLLHPWTVDIVVLRVNRRVYFLHPPVNFRSEFSTLYTETWRPREAVFFCWGVYVL